MSRRLLAAALGALTLLTLPPGIATAQRGEDAVVTAYRSGGNEKAIAGFQQRVGTAAVQRGDDAVVTAYRTGRYDEAIAGFRQRARGAAASAADHRNLVLALAEVGRYEQAEAAARRFIAAEAASAEVHNALGEVLWATGRLDAAEAAFQRAVDGGADDRLDAELNLAIAAFDRGRHAEAMQRFDRFIDYYNNGVAVTAAELTAVGIACQYLGIQDSALFQDALRSFDEAVAADAGALEPRVRIGELFLAKYDSGSAATELANVLQRNPQHPRGLLAMARRMQFDQQAGEATEMLEGALRTNPNLVAARVLRARNLLTAERIEAAIVEIEEALEINPNALDALAVLATAHYLRDDTAAFERTRDRVLALNPRFAEFYNTLADLLIQNRLYAQAVDFAREATTIDPQSWRGHSILGLNQLRIGDIEGGRASLETAFAGDPYNLWVKNTLDLLDTFADYVETSTERFDLMTEAPEAELLGLYLGDLAEEAYDYFEARYGYSPPTPIRIEVYPSHADFSVRTVGLAGLGALGVSFGPVIAIDSPSARPIGEFNWGSTLWHEIAHTFTLGATDFKVPRWVSEGLSVYEERRARRGWGDDADVGFLIAHQRGMLSRVSAIADGFVRPAYPEHIAHSYYQASLVFELIDRDHGFEAIVGLLDAYRRGLSTEDAFVAVLGVKIEDFDDTFNDYLDGEFAVPLAALAHGGGDGDTAPPSPADIERRARANPEDFRAQLAHGIALYEADAHREAEPFLEAAKRLFPGYAAPGSPYWYLALIARERGDLRRAAAELETLTGINEKLYEPNAELAAIYDELGETAQGAAALERLLYVYPLEIAMHLRLADLYEQLGDHERSIRERRAVVALRPSDMAQAWYLLARAQFNGGELGGARRSILRSLEIAPSYPAAQELLLSIVGGIA